MKKILLIIFCFLSFFASAQTLKGGVSEEYIPNGFYGSWAVISILKTSDNPDIFNYQSKDIWTLSGYGDILVLENLDTGARSEIVLKEKNKDGKTLKFQRQKTINQSAGKTVFKETVEFILNGDKFSGNDNFIVEKYDKQDNLLKKNSAQYKVSGIKIAGN